MSDTLTPDRLAELRLIAELATPGRREVRKIFSNGCEGPPEIWIGTTWLADMTGAPRLGFKPYPDAAQIAAFDRETSIMLVDEILRLQVMLLAAAERIAAQSELLSKRAEKSN